MWTPFIHAAIILVLILYVPGILFLRGLRARWDVAIMAAPLLTVAFYAVRPIMQANAGVSTTWNSLFTPALVIGIIVFVIGTVLHYFVFGGSDGALLSKLKGKLKRATPEAEADEPAPAASDDDIAADVALRVDQDTSEMEAVEGPAPSKTAAFIGGIRRRAAARKGVGRHSSMPAPADDDDAVVVKQKQPFHWEIILMYVVLGVIVLIYAFLSNVSDPGSFVTYHDNQHHLNSIQNFLDSGNWSSLALTLYRDSVGAVAPLTSSGQFYPSAWHGLCAMVVQAAGLTVPEAANLVISVLIAVVYPLGVCLLLLSIFPESKRVAGVGSVVCLGFAAFPWALLTFGIVSPQTAAYAVVPLALAPLVLLFEERSVLGVVRNLILIAAGIVAVILLNTTALFTLALLFGFCGSSRVCRLVGGIKPLKKFAKPLGFVAGAIVLYIAYRLWAYGLGLDFISNVVNNSNKWFCLFPQALRDGLTFKFTGRVPQFVMMILTFSGIGYLVYKRQFWLIGPAVFMMTSYVICAGDIDNEPLRLFFTGYWYREPHRIAASACVCCVPLAACGLYAISEFIAVSLRRLCIDKHVRVPRAQTVVAFICIVAAIHVFMPSLPAFVDYDEQDEAIEEGEAKAKAEGTLDEYYYEYPEELTAFGSVADEIHFFYGKYLVYEYEGEEWDFSDKVVDEIGHELVLNEPIDGSVYAYGASAVNTFYRYNNGYGSDRETEDSKIIRTRLCDISWDGAVQDAVRRTGAKYVVLYDMGAYKGAQRDYNPVENWTGFERITTNTPGFEVVLQDEDMVLLKITAID